MHNCNQSVILLNWHLCLSIQSSPFYLNMSLIFFFCFLEAELWTVCVISGSLSTYYLNVPENLVLNFNVHFWLQSLLAIVLWYIQIKLACIACTADVLKHALLLKYLHAREWIHHNLFLPSQQYSSWSIYISRIYQKQKYWRNNF